MHENKERHGMEETKNRKSFSFSRISSLKRPYEYLLTSKLVRVSKPILGSAVIV